jgi:hypothetical protein
MAISALRQRIKDQSLTPAIVATALGLQQIIDRTIDGPPGGRTYERIEAWLDDVETTGYTPGSITPLPDPRPGCTKALGGVCSCAVCGRERVEAKALHDAFVVADREKLLAARAASTQRYVAEAVRRTTRGLELRQMRLDAGLTLVETATLIGLGMTLEQLSRLERGIPSGSRFLAEVEAGYEGLAKLSPKAKKAASK